MGWVALLIDLINKVIALFQKTPAQKAKEALNEIDAAIKKAESDKDPSDLARSLSK